MRCYECGKNEHYAAQCPVKADEKIDTEKEEMHYAENVSMKSDADTDEESVIVSYCNHMAGEVKCDDTAILLDTGSTVSVFKNRKMLTDIETVQVKMRAVTNGGHQDSNEKGILPGFFPVWVNQNSRLNILAWRDVRRHF